MITIYVDEGNKRFEVKNDLPSGYTVEIWEADKMPFPSNRKLLVRLSRDEARTLVCAVEQLEKTAGAKKDEE